MTLDPALQKRRLAIMGGVDGVALLCALAAAVAYFKFGLASGLAIFAIALVMGFGAQIWFIAGLRRSAKGDE